MYIVFLPLKVQLPTLPVEPREVASGPGHPTVDYRVLHSPSQDQRRGQGPGPCRKEE